MPLYPESSIPLPFPSRCGIIGTCRHILNHQWIWTACVCGTELRSHAECVWEFWLCWESRRPGRSVNQGGPLWFDSYEADMFTRKASAKHSVSSFQGASLDTTNYYYLITKEFCSSSNTFAYRLRRSPTRTLNCRKISGWPFFTGEERESNMWPAPVTLKKTWRRQE